MEVSFGWPTELPIRIIIRKTCNSLRAGKNPESNQWWLNDGRILWQADLVISGSELRQADHHRKIMSTGLSQAWLINHIFGYGSYRRFSPRRKSKRHNNQYGDRKRHRPSGKWRRKQTGNGEPKSELQKIDITTRSPRGETLWLATWLKKWRML